MRAFLCYNKDAKKRRTVQCTDKPKSKQKEKKVQCANYLSFSNKQRRTDQCTTNLPPCHQNKQVGSEEKSA